LRAYGDLVSWARQAGVISEDAARKVAARAERDPRGAARALAKAKDLREATFRVFAAEAAGRRPAPEDLDRLNAFVRDAYAHRAVARTPAGYEWTWDAQLESFDSLLWPVVRSAVELLTSGELERVRECGAADCAWLFLDTSRNQSRRWCDMKVCGNREKARRHYARRRQAR
jgi:predicted RNA-binding Zn ribbon-like protein